MAIGGIRRHSLRYKEIITEVRREKEMENEMVAVVVEKEVDSVGEAIGQMNC